MTTTTPFNSIPLQLQVQIASFLPERDVEAISSWSNSGQEVTLKRAFELEKIRILNVFNGAKNYLKTFSSQSTTRLLERHEIYPT